MQMILESMTEHPDGSATIALEADPDAMKLIVSVGLCKMLMDFVEANKQSLPYEEPKDPTDSEGSVDTGL
jgi:hypothetical protein